MDFQNKLAIVSGGGTGMGSELVRQLAQLGCNVAFCDVIQETALATLDLVTKESPGVKITAHIADVSKQEDWDRFKAEVVEQHGATKAHFLFLQAGIGGGGSFLNTPHAEWQKTFDISWLGVLYGCRTFLPLLQAAAPEQCWVCNTSSINGFHGVLTIGPDGTPQTAYAAAKFAIKGFSESLLIDFRQNAPHIGVSVVMPGHIGTKIAHNTAKILSGAKAVPYETTEEFEKMAEMFEKLAPVTPAQAATIILDGVRNKKWRILVGKDAEIFDREVRADPENAYSPEFFAMLKEKVVAEHGRNISDSVSSLDGLN